MVSIHAPARGATYTSTEHYAPIACFNPRTRTGCDYGTILQQRETRLFQSTHPHGVRHPFLRLLILVLRFQSTHPHGVRLWNYPATTRDETVSIHAPARGATPVSTAAYTRIKVSIHAPARGATSPETPIESKLYVSIHAPTGCDFIKSRNIQTPSVSIHAPARGATY